MQTSHQACLILPGRFVPVFPGSGASCACCQPTFGNKACRESSFLNRPSTHSQRWSHFYGNEEDERKRVEPRPASDRLKWLTVLCMSSGIEPNQLQQPVCHERIHHDGLKVGWWWTKNVLLLCDFKKRNRNCDCLFLMLLPPAPATPKHLKTFLRHDI